MNAQNRSAKHLTSRSVASKRVVVTGLLAGLVLALTGCGGGGKNVYQSAGNDIDGGWIIIDGDSVTVIDPDSDGIEQAIADIEDKQVNPNSDSYDVENGALNEAKDMVRLEGGDGTTIELADHMIRLDGEYVYLEYESDLAKKDREAVSPTGD